jgi:hypothetical protein
MAVDPNPTNKGPYTKKEETIGGFEQFNPNSFTTKKSFGNLKYPITINSAQDRIFISQIEYKRTGVVQREGNFADLQSTMGSVTLPMPNDITESNSVGWGEDSLSNIAAMLMPGAVSAVGSAAQGDFITALSTGTATAGATLKDPGFKERTKKFLTTRAAAGIIGKLGIQINPEAYITRSTGAAINPNLELLFNGPKLRQFGFQFKMTPRSQDEATSIRKIIRFFKQGMSPKKGAGDASFFLGTPNVFKIKFQPGEGNDELKSIGKIKTCALVSFSVNYTPDGFYAAYQDSIAGGSQPISVVMQLGFSELTPIFNDEYDDNYDDIGPNLSPKADKIDIPNKTSPPKEPNIPGGTRAGTVPTPPGGGSSTKAETIGTGQGGISKPVGGR